MRTVAMSSPEVATLAGHRGSVVSLAFALDGTLASGGNDTTILLWDTNCLPRSARLEHVKLDPQELEARWAELTAQDAAKAFRAMQQLVATPQQAVMLLKKHMPIEPADSQVVAALIADLDHVKFDKRQSATKELDKLGARAEGALRKALEQKPALEVARRVEGLLGPIEASQLPMLRGIEVLERIRSDEARELLAALVGAAPGSPIGCNAQGALDRLGRKLKSKQ